MHAEQGLPLSPFPHTKNAHFSRFGNDAIQFCITAPTSLTDIISIIGLFSGEGLILCQHMITQYSCEPPFIYANGKQPCFIIQQQQISSLQMVRNISHNYQQLCIDHILHDSNL